MAGPSGATARLALPYPVGADSVDVPRDVQALATKLDPGAAIFAQGTAATRPAPGIAGRYYYATDTANLTYDTGTAWLPVGPQGGYPQVVTVLPASPFDGQEVYYSTGTPQWSFWHLKYQSGWGDGYGWQFLGGPPLGQEVPTSQNTTSGAYVDLPTVGPQVTVPLAGLYNIAGGTLIITTGVASSVGIVAVKFGAATALDTDTVARATAAAATVTTFVSSGQLMGRAVTAGAVLKLQYRSGASQNNAFSERWLQVTPIRVAA